MADGVEALGRLMLDLESTSLSAAEQDLLKHPAVGGVILFSRNFSSRTQLKDLVAALRDRRPELLLAVDQEGGRVQRFKSEFTALPPLHSIEPRFRQDAEAGCRLARLHAWLMATEILDAGLDFSFAPVLDLYSADSQVIADRAFAADVESTVTLAQAYIAGLHEAGMVATGKHYPGHGSVVADSHVELPVDDRPAEAILEGDYRVFARCADVLDGIMPAHVRYPALDDACAGFSRYWLQDKLRNELEFDGVIFSDDLSMAAAHSVGSVEQRLESALTAGCDMALVCNDRRAALAALDWLDAENLQTSRRLPALRGRPTRRPGFLKDDSGWREARLALEELAGFSHE